MEDLRPLTFHRPFFSGDRCLATALEKKGSFKPIKSWKQPHWGPREIIYHTKDNQP
jgi:hypothetical protein